MGMSTSGSGGSQGRRGRRRARAHVMADMNVTPMVDVMLVLLIIFMVSAPLMTVGVPVDLPQTSAKSMDQTKDPITVSVNDKGQIFIGESEVQYQELIAKVQAVTHNNYEERIFVRGDKKVDYGAVMRVMGRLSSAGFKKVALVTEAEQGS